MALPRRGTRKIAFNTLVYRWLVRRHDKGFRLIAEASTDPGMRLVVEVPLSVFPSDAQIMSPGLVRQCIELAIADGYDATSPTGEHHQQIEQGDLAFGQINQEELKKRPVGRPRKRAPGEKRRPVYVSLETKDRARLQAIAETRGLALGTLVKAWVLDRLEIEERLV
jgi:hypothetical protein